MSVNYAALAASDGNGEAVRATVTVQRSVASTTLTVDHTTHWPTGTFIATTGTLLATGKLDPATVQVFYGTASGTTITISSFAAGYSDLGNAIGDVVVLKPSTEWANGVSTAAQAMDTFVKTNGDWRATSVPNTVTALGNRSYSIVVNTTDLTGTLSRGMRLRTTRTVTAPTQCTSLNGTTQYYSKTSPAGMTFTDDFTVSAWVKLASYNGATNNIASRFNGTSGWSFEINSSGQVKLVGLNAGGANFSQVLSYQSIPINKWVFVQANLDMSAFTTNTDGGASGSTIAIDGVNVPSAVTRGGTNPTALIQAGNLEIGSQNGGSNPFNGKIAQVAIWNSKITIATMLTYLSQGLAGTETSLISAYSFNNSINDLNANANNLSANGSAVATNADSPFGGQADGTISSTLDYAIITKTAFSTNTTLTVQVPEGCTIPTSGGVSAVSYATVKCPYGMPIQRGKWRLESILRTSNSTTSNATYGAFISGGWALNVPIGEWMVGWQATSFSNTTTEVDFNLSPTALTGLSSTAGAALSPLSAAITSAAASFSENSIHLEQPQSVAAQVSYVMYTFGATTGGGIDGSKYFSGLYSELAYL